MSAGLELHEASSVGDADALEDFLKSGLFDVNEVDLEWKNKTPLHWAASNGHVDCVRLLLAHGAHGSARMDMGWTAAHCAAEAGRIGALRALHAAGAPVTLPDKYGDTPCRVAQIYGHTAAVEFLIV